MTLHGGQINVFSLQARKRCFSMQLLEIAPGMKYPACALSEPYIARSMRPCRGLLPAESWCGMWRNTCCRVTGDLESVAMALEASLFIHILRIRNTLQPFSILIRDPLASYPELAQYQSPPQAPLACGLAWLWFSSPTAGPFGFQENP